MSLEKKIDDLTLICTKTQLDTAKNTVVLKEHARRTEASEKRITYLERWMLGALLTTVVLLGGALIGAML